MLGIERLRDRGGDAVHLDALVDRRAAQRVGHHAGEVADAHAGLEHRAAVEAEALGRAPHRADDLLRGEVGVLDRAAGGLVLFGRQELRELGADVLEALAVGARHRVREHGLEAAPPDVLGDRRLFLGRGEAVLGGDLLDEADSGDVVARLLLGSRGSPRASRARCGSLPG
jgi:hypothetical protein